MLKKKDSRAIWVSLPPRVSQFQGVSRSAIPIAFDMTVRDTQKYSGYRNYANCAAHQGPSLKLLVQQVLGRPIKQGRVSSVEDALATMEVYRNAEVAIDPEQTTEETLSLKSSWKVCEGRKQDNTTAFGYIRRTAQDMQLHCRNKHGWTNPRKRGWTAKGSRIEASTY